MRTLEEVKKHVYEIGYTNEAQLRIAGFLVGVGVKSEYEIIRFKNGVNEFSTFLHWFNDSPSDYFRRKDVIVNDGKVLFEEGLKTEKPELKAKAYKNGEWEEVNFDEMIKSLKDFKPVICEKVLSDSMLDVIMKELGIGDNDNSKKSNKYKKRELSILDSMGLDKINPLALSTEALKAVNKLLQRRNDLAREIDEAVD